MQAGPPHHQTFTTLQNVNSPDFDLSRDILGPGLEGEALLGMGIAERSGENRSKVNLATILISALIFLAILAWFDFIQTTFFVWLSPPETVQDTIPSSVKFWYAILCTVIVLILVALIYYHFYDYIK